MQHTEIEEQVLLYALGGMSAEESARVRQHLDICPSCRALLSEYQFVADEILEQVPAKTAPARIGVRLQNIAEASARDARRGTPGERRTVPADGHGHRTDAPAARNTPRFWNQRLALPRWVVALALIVLLLLAGAVGALALQMQQSRVSAEVMQLFTTRDLRYVMLSNETGTTSQGGGFICLVRDKTAALLWLYNLQPLDHDHVYQIWLRRDTVRDNGGTFRADYDGRALALIKAPRPLSDYQEIGITVEPAAGSQWPTTPRLLGGKLD